MRPLTRFHLNDGRNPMIARQCCTRVACGLLVGLALIADRGRAQDAKPTPTATSTGTATAAPPSATATGTAKKPNWGADFVKNDPLMKKTEVSAADLQAALADPQRAATALELHFSRAVLAPEEQRQLLTEALAHNLPVVRAQAAAQLKRLGMLEAVLVDLLLKLADDGNAEVRQAAIIALQNVAVPWDKVSADYRKALFDALASDDAALRTAAVAQLKQSGGANVAELIATIRTGNAVARRAAADAISGILAPPPPTPIAGLPPSPAPSGTGPGPTIVTAKGAPSTAPTEHVERGMEPKAPQPVRVYYGTNREIIDQLPDPQPWLYGLPVAFLFGLFVLVRPLLRKKTDATKKSGWLWVLTRTAVGLLLVVGSAVMFNDQLRSFLTKPVGVVYGPRRDNGGKVHYGYCDVTIPPTHELGKTEQPMIGAEDENEHVMIRRIAELKEKDFFDEIRRVLAEREIDQRDCFVFVHGYNVSFDKAARRTAQMHYDLKFPGAPIFYSWPSRANLRSYFSDRNEIFYSYEHIKQFLEDVAERVGARRVHVIAHSMGGDAVCRAILAMGDKGRLFDQIILAAPDLDADVFREQIAPKLQQISKRTTLYCSRNDWALHASYAFNDSWRLGDSSRGIVCVDGMDTVDASNIDTDLLGHSYYGDCLKLIHDVELLIDKNLPPPDRRLAPSFADKQEAKYWTFASDAPTE